MSDYIRKQTLAYAARFTQLAEQLLCGGVLSFAERNEIAQCRALIELAVYMREVPADTLPLDYTARVDRALARMDLTDEAPSVEVASWN